MELIKDRLAHIIRAKNLTAAQFAEIMEIQPSNVSHLLNGRNKPSLDFLIKLKNLFPEYSFDWIIMGKKPITINESSPVPKNYTINDIVDNKGNMEFNYDSPTSPPDFKPLDDTQDIPVNQDNNDKSGSLKQIIYIYEDMTFDVYNIRK